MMRPLLIVSAVAVAIALAWLAWDGWSYLQRGYSIGVSTAGHPTSEKEVDFPAWRAGVHILLWLAAMIATGAYLAGRPWASSAAWVTFAITSFVALCDVVQYGILGSPSSIWTVLLLLLLALLSTFAPLN